MACADIPFKTRKPKDACAWRWLTRVRPFPRPTHMAAPPAPLWTSCAGCTHPTAADCLPHQGTAVSGSSCRTPCCCPSLHVGSRSPVPHRPKEHGCTLSPTTATLTNLLTFDPHVPAGLLTGLTQNSPRNLTARLPKSRRVLHATRTSPPPGGVLLDSGGRVIGINTAIADPSGKGASAGVGFALPIDAVKGLVDQILQYGRVLRPVLGVTLAPPQVGLGADMVDVYGVGHGAGMWEGHV